MVVGTNGRFLDRARGSCNACHGDGTWQSHVAFCETSGGQTDGKKRKEKEERRRAEVGRIDPVSATHRDHCPAPPFLNVFQIAWRFVRNRVDYRLTNHAGSPFIRLIQIDASWQPRAVGDFTQSLLEIQRKVVSLREVVRDALMAIDARAIHFLHRAMLERELLIECHVRDVVTVATFT